MLPDDLASLGKVWSRHAREKMVLDWPLAADRLHELESALSSVDSRIASNYRTQESIKKELTDIGVRMIATDTTAEQRLAMVTRSADLGRRYGELTTEIQQLERERAVAERSLLEYRATLAAAF